MLKGDVFYRKHSDCVYDMIFNHMRSVYQVSQIKNNFGPKKKKVY